MATSKAAGSTRLGRDSVSKRLGVKKFSGEIVEPGNIIIRQRGKKYMGGINTKTGSDDTIYSMTNGTVQFLSKRIKTFTGANRDIKVVSVKK